MPNTQTRHACGLRPLFRTLAGLLAVWASLHARTAMAQESVARSLSVTPSVSVGQTLCIIEAMKVMNEIKAERSGTITAVFIEEGTPVQYGDAMFGIK